MSAPNPSPTPDAGSEPRPNGQTGSQGLGPSGAEPGRQASSEANANASRRDYVGRIKSEPDFAVEQVQHWQGQASKAGEQLRSLEQRLGPLADYLGSVDGKVLAQLIQEYQVLAKEPSIAQAIQSYREHGKVRLPDRSREEDTTVEDDYLTDTERAFKQRMDTLEQRNQQLESLLSQTTQNFGVQSLSQHLEKVFTDFGLVGDRAEQVRQQLTKQVDQWAQQGEPGRKALADLQRPDGKDTVELMVMRALGREGLLEIAKEQQSRESRARAGLATDVPSQFGTTGDEPPTEHKSIREAIAHARAHPEVLGRY